MFRQLAKIGKPFQIANRNRLFSTAQAAAVEPVEKWDLYAGVIVERTPILCKELNDIERKYQDLLSRIEFEKSLKSDFELRNERDLKQIELIKEGKSEVDLDDSAIKQTAQDLKDAYSEELKNFQIAPRKTADDAKNDLSSLDRCLDESLYLLVEQKFGSKSHLALPQGPRNDGETMRQTAERVVREKCGDHIQFKIYGNAPCGFYKYKYPADARKESLGAKVFFYYATLNTGNISKDMKFEWIPKTDIKDKLKNSSYSESILKCIL